MKPASKIKVLEASKKRSHGQANPSNHRGGQEEERLPPPRSIQSPSYGGGGYGREWAMDGDELGLEKETGTDGY